MEGAYTPGFLKLYYYVLEGTIVDDNDIKPGAWSPAT